MAFNSEEQQQIEEIKNWWKENYKVIIFSVVIAVVAALGWRYWQAYQIENAKKASDDYQTALHQYYTDTTTNETALETFANQHSRSAYAVFALLNKAKEDVKQAHFEQAKIALQQAMSMSKDSILTAIAGLRLGAVEIQLAHYDDALVTLEKVNGKAWENQKLIMQGDIYFIQNKRDQAREAYTKALLQATPTEQPLLQIRLNNL